MAKTTAPILSFGGRGQVGQTVVYGQWRGVKYARSYVVPANPRTVEQTKTRSVFANLRELWKLLPADARAPWEAFTTGRPLTGVNAFIGENMRVLRSAADMASFIASPGARGGINATLIAAIPGGLSGEIAVTFTDPALPASWAIVDHVVIARPDQDPHDPFFGPWVIAKGAAANPTITLTGLTGGTSYVVSSFLKQSKPDGSFAYSVSETSLVVARV